MAIEVVVTDVDDMLLPYESKKHLAAQMMKDGTKWRLPLVFHGLSTYAALGKVKKYHKAGNDQLAGEWSVKSYERFDKIIDGVDVEYIEKFGRKCGKDIPAEACEAFEDLHAKGYELYAISGGITELTTAAFKEAGIKKYFSEIIANPIDSRVVDYLYLPPIAHGLIKNVSKPTDKLAIFKPPYSVKPKKTAAIGHDYYDIALLEKAALPICKIGGKVDSEAYRIAQTKGIIIKRFEQLQKIFK